jgi:hypothetical protein
LTPFGNGCDTTQGMFVAVESANHRGLPASAEMRVMP